MKQVLRSSDYGADNRQCSAAVFVLLIGFAKQLRLEVTIILTPFTTRYH